MKQLVFDTLLFAYFLGLVLVGVFRPGDEALLHQFPFYSTVALGLVAVGAVLAGSMRRLGVKTIGAVLFATPAERSPEAPPSWWRTFWGIELLLLFALTLAASMIVTEFSFRELFSEAGFTGAKNIFVSLAKPERRVLPVAVLSIFETIFMAFLATALALPPSFVLGFLCAKNLMRHSLASMIVYVVLRGVLNIIRSIEPLIWAIIFSVWVGIGPFAGVLALMIHTVASLAKQYSEMVESIDEGPLEAIQATGASSLQVVWFAVVPQIVLPYLSFTIYRWDINVRMSTIIGLVGGGGIGTLLNQFQGQALWREVGCLALVIVIAVWAMDVASAYIREALK